MWHLRTWVRPLHCKVQNPRKHKCTGQTGSETTGEKYKQVQEVRLAVYDLWPRPFPSPASVPGFGHVAKASRAVYLQHVALAHFWSAHRDKVGPQASDGVLGHIGQRLAHTRAEQKRPHHFIERRSILVKVWIGVETFGVDQVGLSRSDLQVRKQDLKVY